MSTLVAIIGAGAFVIGGVIVFRAMEAGVRSSRDWVPLFAIGLVVALAGGVACGASLLGVAFP